MGEDSKYSRQKYLGYFSIFRSVLWVVVISFVFDNYFIELRRDTVRTYFAVSYQFYVLFSSYAFIQLTEGLNNVSES